MPKEILIATHNEHKKQEIQQILGAEFIVKSLADFQLHDEIIENGNTFEENAYIKAAYCFKKTGLPSIGDDSGLVVEALDGRPGIYSARYAGNHDFDANIQKVLSEMEGKENRRAYFITVLCMIDQYSTKYFEGRAEGYIIEHNQGYQGFGYDPIFRPDGYKMTFAEMTPEEKNTISHRKKAFDKLLKDIHQF